MIRHVKTPSGAGGRRRVRATEENCIVRIGYGDRDLVEKTIEPAKPRSLKLLIFVLLHDWVRDKNAA
jgi:hypothetical protein